MPGKTDTERLLPHYLDSAFTGFMRKDGGGWMLEEYSHEELNAENVQLIGDQIDGLP